MGAEGGEGRAASGRRGYVCALLLLFLEVALSCRSDKRTPVLLYSPHGRDLLGLLERTYEKAHPEIDIRWLDMGSQEVYDRVRSEKANPQGDVWFGGPDTIFYRGAREGLLQPYRPGWASAIPAEARDSRDLYFGAYRTPAVIVYNSAAVSPADAPKDWDDLLDPKWKGKIIIRYPLASGTMRAIFGLILARSIEKTGSPAQGYDWLKRLDAQTKSYEMNASVLVQRIARREGLVTVWDLPDVLLEMKHSRNLAYSFPTSGTPVIDDAIGIVAGARHLPQARAFLEWVGSPEAQRLAANEAYRLPARTDIPPAELPAWARDVQEKLVPARLDWALLERQGAMWMSTWDREVRGRGSR
ncbi:MAG: extracellular solute-binding protein [Acidobacteria bacterium]|nr:extracellular solute-binding protein [Acidobacteriota bacterium]MCA1610088.1 extracellular solute-binding protein [Acidobacteriota bacterium]